MKHERLPETRRLHYFSYIFCPNLFLIFLIEFFPISFSVLFLKKVINPPSKTFLGGHQVEANDVFVIEERKRTFDRKKIASLLSAHL